ncbi:MAG TPA: GlxA family transcriptional regulator [Mesorhizobium sp.]|jgi:transcriptional regulator GlxA family with amidase domain|nr:GlxA family transcriptional regulator [Mesorhizobium sp.]
MMKSEQPFSIFQPERKRLDVTFLLLPGASVMCVASSIDPLRAANRVCGEEAFRWVLRSTDGSAPLTTAGLPVAVEGPFDPAAGADALVVVGGFGTRSETSPALLAGLRRAARGARAVGGVEAGGWLLGRAGLLDGRAATTHWEDMEDFSAAFPRTEVKPDRYVIDGKIFTTGGASPTFDLMLHLIRTRLGMAVALDVASVFIYDGARAGAASQPLVSLGRPDGFSPRLVEAIRLMEAHLEQPLTAAAIARRVGLSARGLENLFVRSIGETPGAYGLRLRLSAARRLVLDTREPLAVIAARTGFSSASSFSRAFARAFGQAPSEMRG